MTMDKNATTTHKTLLAGAGVYDSAREKAADTLDQLFVSGSQLINELLEKGESVEAELYAKLEVKKMLREKIAMLKAKLGFGNNASDQQLDMLNQRVDSLIDVVAKLAQQKAAEQKTPAKAPAKRAAKAKPAANTRKAVTKAAAKPATKTKTTNAAATPETKPASKAKVTRTPAKAAAVKTVKKTTEQPAEKALSKLRTPQQQLRPRLNPQQITKLPHEV